MSQRDEVLAMLKAAGPAGVHTFEMRSRYIGNPSQRIADLEALGHRFTRVREKLHGRAVGTRYRLVVSDASAARGSLDTPARPASGTIAAGASETTSLFNPAALVEPKGAYDDVWDDAA